jgi:hypothetical protein
MKAMKSYERRRENCQKESRENPDGEELANESFTKDFCIEVECYRCHLQDNMLELRSRHS